MSRPSCSSVALPVCRPIGAMMAPATFIDRKVLIASSSISGFPSDDSTNARKPASLAMISMRLVSAMKKGSSVFGMTMPMMLLRRRLRLTANILGRKPDFFSASSIVSRVLRRTEVGSLKYFDTVGRDRPTNSEKSSIVLIALANRHTPSSYRQTSLYQGR